MNEFKIAQTIKVDGITDNNVSENALIDLDKRIRKIVIEWCKENNFKNSSFDILDTELAQREHISYKWHLNNCEPLNVENLKKDFVYEIVTNDYKKYTITYIETCEEYFDGTYKVIDCTEEPTHSYQQYVIFYKGNEYNDAPEWLKNVKIWRAKYLLDL